MSQASRRHRANIVTDDGFGTAAPSRASQQPGRVADAGFGAAAAPAQKSEPRTVQATDFDARPAPAVARAPREPRIEVPLEILSKPTPEYTEEARTLRIEGDARLHGQPLLLEEAVGLGDRDVRLRERRLQPG